MTEQEKLNEGIIVRNKIKQLCDDHPNFGFFVLVDARDYGQGYKFLGNQCPRCASEIVNMWVDEENIPHNDKITHQ